MLVQYDCGSPQAQPRHGNLMTVMPSDLSGHAHTETWVRLYKLAPSNVLGTQGDHRQLPVIER